MSEHKDHTELRMIISDLGKLNNQAERLINQGPSDKNFSALEAIGKQLADLGMRVSQHLEKSNTQEMESLTSIIQYIKTISSYLELTKVKLASIERAEGTTETQVEDFRNILQKTIGFANKIRFTVEQRLEQGPDVATVRQRLTKIGMDLEHFIGADASDSTITELQSINLRFQKLRSVVSDLMSTIDKSKIADELDTLRSDIDRISQYSRLASDRFKTMEGSIEKDVKECQGILQNIMEGAKELEEGISKKAGAKRR